MLKTNRSLERLTSKELEIINNKVIRYDIGDGNSLLNQKIV